MAIVDIAIPNYQHGRYLRECVSSVLSQGMNDIRILIIDNASTDNSVEIAGQLASEDHRVEVVVHPTNLGSHASANEAVDWAASEYFFLLCADDYLASDMLQGAVRHMEMSPNVNIAIGKVILFQDGESPIQISGNMAPTQWQAIPSRDFLESNCREPMNYTSAAGHALFRTTALKQAGYYRLEISHAMDVDMMLRIASLGDVARTRSAFAYRRDHNANQSLAYRDNFALRLAMVHEAFESFFAHEGGLLPNGERLRKLEKRSLGARAWWAAVSHLLRGQPKASSELFKLAFDLSPRTAVLPPLDYLLEMERPFARATEVIAEALKRAQALASPRSWF